MAMYDFFVRHQHPPIIQALMRYLNKNILAWVKKWSGKTPHKLRILEIGAGKGYFHSACEQDDSIEYYVLDRNRSILDALKNVPSERKRWGEVPEIPDFGVKFDVIYAAFVVEHLPGGGPAIYDFVNHAKKRLRAGGILILQAPDAEKLGMEFWNIDYTHMFPTTKRSLAHAFYDNEIYAVDIYDISGLLTHRYFPNKYIYLMLRMLLFPYNYKLFNAMARYTLGTKSYCVGNLFFSAFGLLKEENLLIVGRMP